MFISRITPATASRLQIFVSDLNATGVVRNAVALANAAADAGYQVRLLTCRPEGPFRNAVSPGVTLVSLLSDRARTGPRHSRLKQALLAYRRHSRDWRPNIMLSSGNHCHLLSTIAWAGLPGFKVVRISNDLSHGSKSWATKIWRDMKFRFVAAGADALVLNSRVLGDHPILAPHAASGKAVTIPNGVNVDAVNEAASGLCLHPWVLNRSVPLALAVARHAKQKNLDTLLHAFSIARRRREMRLIILGHSDAAETPRLKGRVEELSLGDDVDFVPATANPFAYMSAASVVALPSLWEGSSNVLLEAMACGTPVVASRTAGDAKHVLGSGDYGILVDPRNVEELAAALLRQTGSQKIVPGERARSFDWKEALSQYIGLFDQWAGRRLPDPVAH
jgi:glycosyltransferase involved in cell wall biosynthesis